MFVCVPKKNEEENRQGVMFMVYPDQCRPWGLMGHGMAGGPATLLMPLSFSVDGKGLEPTVPRRFGHGRSCLQPNTIEGLIVFDGVEIVFMWKQLFV